MNTLFSIHDSSANGLIVEIQTHLSNSLPNIHLIGVVGKSLDESKDRIRSAFSSSDMTLPRKKITINISPSDIPKDGAHYDLALAVSILLESGQIKSFSNKPIFLGELGLNGDIKSVRGILGKVLIAKKAGFTHFVVPKDNENQVKLIPNIHILSVSNLKSLKKQLDIGNLRYLDTLGGSKINSTATDAPIDFSEIIGQNIAKRALEIAAAGQHNVLLSGPPGVGKSMLAKALIGIMPPLSRNEVITITHLHSLVGNQTSELIVSRPIRSPHHSASDVSIIGGGQKPKPGEITLSHKGILFLDELPEFKRSTIESLRQPLEDKQVTVTRAKDSTTYPADFLLIATKNPCPCGYYGSTNPCVCSPLELDRYQKKLSGPLLDRIDLHVTVDKVDHKALLKKDIPADSNKSQEIRARVQKAIEKNNKRFAKNKKTGSMTNKEIKKFANMSSEAKEMLDTAASKLNISARVYMKTVKVARTIADLDVSDTVEKQHVSEALRYRPIEQN